MLSYMVSVVTWKTKQNLFYASEVPGGYTWEVTDSEAAQGDKAVRCEILGTYKLKKINTIKHLT